MFTSLLLCCFFYSCSVGPSYVAPEIPVPGSWKSGSANECDKLCEEQGQELVFADYWWQVFDDAKLNELEALALANNRDLFVALERVRSARDIMGIAAADLYPQITLTPNFSNTNQLTKNYNINALSGLTSATGTGAQTLSSLTTNEIFREHVMLYFLPLNFNYEIDLWGKITDRYNAAKYSWLALKKDYEAIMLNLTANVGSVYFQIRSADAELNLLSQVVETRKKAYEINKARYEEQITNYADVTLAAEEVNTVVSQYYEMERMRAVLENELAILLGLPASEFCLEAVPFSMSQVPPCIPAGIPSEVILRRPDVAEAELNARSQHAYVKEAYALFFPSLTLTSVVGFESPVLKYFLHRLSRYLMYQMESDQVIFDGGRLEYNLDEQIANFKQASGTYQKQVLIALQDVENALENIHSYSDQYKVAQQTVEWAKKTYQIYLDRYTLGVINYIDVANTERDLLNYQINVNTLQGLRFIAAVQLIQALGGGW